MSDMKLSVIVEAIDRLTEPFRRMSEAVKGPAEAARKMAEHAGEMIEKVRGSYEGLAVAIGGGFEIREIMKDNDAFKMLGINAEASETRIESLRDRLIEVAQASRVSLDELTAGFNQMRSNGANLDDAEESLGAMATTIQRLSGQGAGIGELFATLERFSDIKGPEVLLKTVATFRDQFGPRGEQFANFMEAAAPLLATYSGQGHSGLNAAKEIGALYSTVAPGAESPRAARSAVEGILQLVGDRSSAQRLMQLGVKVYGSDADQIAGRTLPVTQIVQDLLQRYTAAPMQFDEVLGAGFKKDFRVPLGEVQKFGFSKTLEERLGVDGDTVKFTKEATEASTRFSASLNSLQTAVHGLGERILARPLQVFADTLAQFPNLSAAFITALGGFAILGTVSGWLSFAWKELSWLRFGLGAVVAGIGDFVLALRAGYGALEALGLVFAANPIGVILLAISALALAAYEIYEHWEPIKDFFVGLWNGIADGLSSAMDRVRAIWSGIVDFVEEKAALVNSYIPDWMKKDHPGGVSDNSVDMMGNSTGIAPTAFPSGSGSGSGQRTDVGGQITVAFENPPPGMKVKDARSNNPRVNFNLDLGYAMGMP